jgi:hypothetical protein
MGKIQSLSSKQTKHKPNQTKKTKNKKHQPIGAWRFWRLSKDRQIWDGRDLNLEQVTNMKWISHFLNFDPVAGTSTVIALAVQECLKLLQKSQSFWMEEPGKESG